MKRALIEWIRCPTCGDQLRLVQEMKWKEAPDGEDEVWEGFLECTTNAHRFPIIKGVLILVRDFSRYISNRKNIFQKLQEGNISPEMRVYLSDQTTLIDQWESDIGEDSVSFFTWAHYDDIKKENILKNAIKSAGIEDIDALSPQRLYTEIRDLMPEKIDPSLPALEVGCSVGRMTHVLAEKSRFAIGMDCSFEAIRTAREIGQSEGYYYYDLRVEGMRNEKRKIDTSSIIKKNVEFIVSDAQNLPFPSTFFGIVLSMNLLDVVQFPIKNLQEVHRVLSVGGYFLMCDPYNWSQASTAKSPDWIGGKEDGSYAGESSTVLRSLLKNELHFRIDREKDFIPWVLRINQRCFSVFLVDCLVAVKFRNVPVLSYV
ncbi:MAG: methyltransferase domain-containing protein [Candidatus Methanofastidiosia archaeon]